MSGMLPWYAGGSTARNDTGYSGLSRSASRSRVGSKASYRTGTTIRNFQQRLNALNSSSKSKRSVRTMLSRQNRKGLSQVDGSGDSSSQFTLIKPRSKFHKDITKDLAPSLNANVFSSRPISLEGKQECFIIPSGGFYDTGNLDAFFSLASPGNNYNSAKVYLERCYGTSLITNDQNSNCRMQIYDVIARSSVQAANWKTPQAAFQNGFGDAAGGVAANYLVPFVNPFTNARFTSLYKVLKTTDVILRPGATHKHVVDYRPNRTFCREDDLSITISGCPVGGLTLYTFVIFSGTPAVDIATKLSTSLTAMHLAVVSSVQYTTYCLEKSETFNTVTNNLPLADAEETMNETGAVQADAFA